MLAFFMWAIGVAANASQNTEFKSQIEFQQKHNNSDFSHFHTIEVEESEFVIIESEPEFEVELDWFVVQKKSVSSNVIKLLSSSNSPSNFLFSSKEIIPLYDLYCNWKFHLS